MASVFLSYDREDSDKARTIATALEKTGHEVWWDLHVRGGAQFSKVIEEALRAADSVVVLWSVRSVESAWVRDEAAAGRDSGRLIPVALDGTEPPMGFRQFQTIDLSGRRGSRWSKHFDELLRSIHDLEPTGAEPTVRDWAAKAKGSRHWSAKWLTISVVAIALLVGAAFGVWRLTNRQASVPVVAVAPADRSVDAAALARDLLVRTCRGEGRATSAREPRAARQQKRELALV